MALNLSTLTNSATSADVLAEVLTTADFLEPVPVLRNLARGSNKSGDAKQDVALNQPKALPLDANGKGYCYLPATTGNAPAVTFPTIGGSDDFVLEMDVYLVNAAEFHIASAPNTASRFLVSGGKFYHGSTNTSLTSSLSTGVSTLKIERASGTITLKQNDQLKASASFSSSVALTFLSYNGQFISSVPPLNGYIQKATLSIGGTEELNIDFTATDVRHNDTKFKCATGQVVTINQSGNDPATIIKKPVLRFDGANDFMNGVFGQTITDGYMFAAFSVLGDGGEDHGRVFSINSTGSDDSSGNGAVFSIKYDSSSDLRNIFNGAYKVTHTDLFDDVNNDILHESLIGDGSQVSRVNNADESVSSETTTISAEEFNIAARPSGSTNPAIDLEFLALFPASITDAQADDVRNYINNRNNVFLRHDTDGYYFYDAQKAPVGPISSGSASWNGRIVGSDNGDSDRYLTQATANDQPVSDGYVVTFADNTDHLEIPQVTQAGWQVVGTSLGTFAYKVNANAVTELNLLGNLGHASYRQAGDLYGIILLPESATGADIEAARKLLIDRGAADGVSVTDLQDYFRFRQDLVEFKSIDTSEVTSFFRTWNGAISLTSFPLIDTSSAINMRQSFQDASNLSSFPAIQAPLCTSFDSTWKSCSSLTSFPADAKLGTEATNVNFSGAWKSSGLTSFSTPLPTAGNCTDAWRTCSSLTDFNLDTLPATSLSSAFNNSGLTSWSTEIPNVTTCSFAWYYSDIASFNISSIPSATSVKYAWIGTPLTSFSTSLPVCQNFLQAWQTCRSLTDFSADVFSNWNPASISSGVFNLTWVNCTSLTAQSVENILTSIDASGKYATSTGASGGSALADAGIDIDYNGDPLSAATTAAIDSLSGKGWQVYINGELVISNILDLQPAAAYSLRSFDADADPNVVNVRRSSDGATSDFTASEVSDGTLTDWVGAGNDGHVTTWYDQRKIVETGDAYGTTISGTSYGAAYAIHNQIAPAVAGEFYRVRFTVSNVDPRGRVRYRNYAGSVGIAATVGLGSLVYFNANGDYEAYVPSDDGLSLWFYSDAGQSFDYSGVSVQQIAEVPNNADNSVASSQPKIVDGGTLVTEGGQAALDFDTGNSNLRLATSAAVKPSNLNNFSLFTVQKASGGSGSYGVRTGGAGDNRLYLPYLLSGTNRFGYGNQLSAIDIGSPTTTHQLVSAIAGSTQGNAQAFVNGASQGSTALQDIAPTTNSVIFGSGPCNGSMQEVIMFHNDQSANRTAIENNINDHFDIYS